MGLMMRKLLLFLALLLPATAFGQTTAVTATITDSDTIAWANGTFRVTFVPNPNYSGIYQYQGAAFSPQVYTGTMNGSGALSITIPDNNFISPAGTQWLFTLCPDASAVCTPVTLPVTGASVSLTGTFSAAAIPPRFPAKGIGSYGYTDVEINQTPVPGGSYYNVTSLCMRIWNGSAFTCPFTGGTVTSVSSGNFSPLFNVSVATPTTTPAFSFTAQNAAAGTIFGNPSGSPAPPSFNTPGSFTGIVSSVTANSPITSSGGANPNIACAGCVTSVSGTGNQIVSSGGTTPTLSLPSTVVAPGSVRATTALRGATVTDDALTSGNCVQAGAAGILTTTANPCFNGGGITQIQAATSSSPCDPGDASQYESCNFTISWPTTFADTSYIATCSLGGTNYNLGNSANNFSNNIFIRSKATGSMSITIQNNRGADNLPAFVDCIGVHP
jgi:hypothetical protein